MASRRVPGVREMKLTHFELGELEATEEVRRQKELRTDRTLVTYMHARPPPRNVILSVCVVSRCFDPQAGDTHRLEYTPGILASCTLPGRAVSQRSGFHSVASSPQIALFLFDERRPTATTVSLGIGISCISVPSTPRMGVERGSTTSSRVLFRRGV